MCSGTTSDTKRKLLDALDNYVNEKVDARVKRELEKKKKKNFCSTCGVRQREDD
jgi:hypothetical protein